ncbi:PucR family transcriptional regulator [Streptomyces uncialis]|uniref:PucR family transcriptional regulator n=1 Tax=Streptomyces uncialis TaxID=1048205 RepID=UPI0037F2E27E
MGFATDEHQGHRHHSGPARPEQLPAAASRVPRSPDSAGDAEHGGHPAREAAWLYRLKPADRHTELTPASAPETVAEATGHLGPEPVAWAVGVGHDMALMIIAEVPELGGGEGPFETLRMGAESATLRALLLLADPTDDASITQEALRGDRDFVRRGISLDKVLRGIRLGHAHMAHAMMTACADLSQTEARTGHVRHVSDTLFRFVDAFSSRMTEEYVAERDRWVTSRAAAREETVRAILAGEAVAPGEAGRTLGYPLTGEHLAISGWCASTAESDLARLQQAAVDFLSHQGCTATLVVPTGRTSLWAWGTGATPHEPAAGTPARHPDVHIAAGSIRAGTKGFRQSHEEALRAGRIARMNPGTDTRVTCYRQIEVVALLSQDLPGLRRFVHDELGPLADDTAHAEQLRETVRHYLQGERSLMAAAERMHVARNTVTYRVKRARQLLGHDIAQRRFEVHTALAAAHVLGSAVLRPARPS